MAVIIDYDAGNTLSVQRALSHLSYDAILTDDPEKIRNASHLILPGVGSFGNAMEELSRRGLIEVIREAVRSGVYFLGICLGLQLLFESSEESPDVEGLSILEGKILRIPKADGLSVPQIGWNSLEIKPESRLFSGIDNGVYTYFVHSYYLKAFDEKIVSSVCEYGVSVHASVERENVFACQFHPEKSGKVGLKILDNFCRMK